MQTRLRSHPKYQGGNLTSRIETPEDPLEEGEEDHHRMPQDHLRVVEVVEEAEVEAVEAVEEAEHFRYLDMLLLHKQRNF